MRQAVRQRTDDGVLAAAQCDSFERLAKPSMSSLFQLTTTRPHAAAAAAAAAHYAVWMRRVEWVGAVLVIALLGIFSAVIAASVEHADHNRSAAQDLLRRRDACEVLALPKARSDCALASAVLGPPVLLLR